MSKAMQLWINYNDILIAIIGLEDGATKPSSNNIIPINLDRETENN